MWLGISRAQKSPMAAYFQPMNYLDIVYYYRHTRSLQSLSKASFVEIWSDLNQDLKKIAHGLAVIELTEKLKHRKPCKILYLVLLIKVRSIT